MKALALLRRLAAYLVMLALAGWIGQRWVPPASFLVWSGAVALLCVVGALLLSRQPIGESTAMGQLGAAVLRWGYRVGRGQLLPIALVSWFLWTVLGGAVVLMVLHRGEPETVLMLAGWTVDLLALTFLVGRMLTNTPGSRGAVLLPALIVVGLIGGSALLWRAGTPTARQSALLLGAAPIPFLGAGYGLVLAAMLLGGRKGGWK